MKTVLLGWSLGGGRGHVGMMVPLARRLVAEGHRCVLALRSLETVWQMYRDEPFVVVPAPPATRVISVQQRYRSYADMMFTTGFSDPEALAVQVRSWDGLIELVDPDLVICDTSPALGLACHGRLPALDIGAAFAVPPRDRPVFPPLCENGTAVASDAAILEVIAEVQRRRQAPIPPDLPAMLPGDHVVGSIRELDPYDHARPPATKGRLWNPGFAAPDSAPGPLRIFAYLNGDFPIVHEVVEALARTGLEVDLVVPEAKSALQELGARVGVRVGGRLRDTRSALAACALCLHHGGNGMAEAALLAARPQICIPLVLEQRLRAEALERLGVGQTLGGRGLGERVLQAVAAISQRREELGRRARELAAEVHAREQEPGVDVAAARALELLGA